MSFLDTIRDAGNTFVNAGGDFIDAAEDVGSGFVNRAEDVGSALVSNGAEFTENVAVNTFQFQANLARVGLERTWDGMQAGARVAGNIFGGITHPGSANPPAAQGLLFSETKSASDLAYDAQLGETYRFPNGQQWRVVDVQDDTRTGFRAIALRSTDPNDNRVIVAYAGTRDGDDWRANIGQGLGLPTRQYSQAVDFANRWKATDGNNVILTGHSLGGGLASYASIKTDLRATAVNAAPLALNHLGLNPFDGRRITQYFVPGEALTVFDQASPLDIRPGIPIAVQGRHSILDPRSVGRNHSLDNVAPNIPAPVRVN